MRDKRMEKLLAKYFQVGDALNKIICLKPNNRHTSTNLMTTSCDLYHAELCTDSWIVFGLSAERDTLSIGTLRNNITEMNQSHHDLHTNH